jgi:hypothetical protein
VRALTLKQPWASAIFNGKIIENRTWVPSDKVLPVGARFAIHAGMSFAKEGAKWIEENFEICYNPESVPYGAILGTVVYQGYITESDNPWFFGPYGWILSDIQPLEEPIRIKGKLRLWVVPPEIEHMINQANKK